MSRSPRSSACRTPASCSIAWCASLALFRVPEVRAHGCSAARNTGLPRLQGNAQVPARRAGARLPHGPPCLSDSRRRAGHAGRGGAPAHGGRSPPRALKAGKRVFRVVIPARYASARLPGKALLSIRGKPMLQWVYERVCASGAHEVLIATDDQLIVSAAHSFGAETVMTAPTHASGTDRIGEVARARRWGEADIVVNVQGDEPLMPPELIVQVAQLLASHPRADLATLATPIFAIEEFMDPNAVKVVTDAQGRALYFSRAPIPWNRDAAPGGLASQ